MRSWPSAQRFVFPLRFLWPDPVEGRSENKRPRISQLMCFYIYLCTYISYILFSIFLRSIYCFGQFRSVVDWKPMRSFVYSCGRDFTNCQNATIQHLFNTFNYFMICKALRHSMSMAHKVVQVSGLAVKSVQHESSELKSFTYEM